MKSIKKVPFSLLKEVIMNEQLEILTNNCIEENEDPSGVIEDLKKAFGQIEDLSDLIAVMNDYGYWDKEIYEIIFKVLIDPKK